jgi:hypothetical protein
MLLNAPAWAHKKSAITFGKQSHRVDRFKIQLVNWMSMRLMRVVGSMLSIGSMSPWRWIGFDVLSLAGIAPASYSGS